MTKKKIICAAAAMCMLQAMTLNAAAETAEPVNGYDINRNGIVELDDAVLVLEYYAQISAYGSNQETDNTVYDADSNGTVDLSDAVQVLTYYSEKAAGLIENTVESAPAVYDNYLFVGDSRTVGMSYAVEGLDTIAKVSMGYKWLTSQLDAIRSYENTNIVIWFGVNDLYNASKYVTLYNELYQEIGDSNNIYIMAVTPCSGNYSYLNSQIENFNATVSSGLDEGIGYIDAYSYLESTGFSSSDGLHYYYSTYRSIHTYACETIKED